MADVNESQEQARALPPTSSGLKLALAPTLDPVVPRADVGRSVKSLQAECSPGK